MARVELGQAKFSVNRFPYSMFHMPSSASLDEDGNVLSESDARWVLKPYRLGTYDIPDGDASDILEHLIHIEKKKAELVEAESELSTQLLKISEQSRYDKSEELREYRQKLDSLIYDLSSAEKDRDKLAVVKRILEEKK